MAGSLVPVHHLRGRIFLAGDIPLMGRPTSLTDAAKALVLSHVRDGNYRETAAAAAGIHRTTLRNWEKRGEEGEEPFASFMTELQRAEAEAEIAALARIRSAQPAITGEGGRGADLWQKDAWHMERRWPKRWSGRVRSAVNEELEALLERIRAKLDDDTFAKVVDATREAAPGADSGASRH
jgi:hypothetical protein